MIYGQYIKPSEWVMDAYYPKEEPKKKEKSEYQKIIDWFCGMDIPSDIQKIKFDTEIDKAFENMMIKF